MANRMRSIGTALESAIVAWLREHGWPYAKRKPQAGGKDEGDIWLSERIPFVIEAKSAQYTTNRAAISTFLKELRVEVRNAGAEAGAVVFKRRGSTDIAKSVVIMEMEDLQVLLKLAYGQRPSRVWREREKLVKVR